MHARVMRTATIVGATVALLASAGLPAAAVPDVETAPVPPIVQRVVSDGTNHQLTTGPGVDEFHDLLVTSKGDIVVSSFHDGRRMNGDFDAWPMRVWTLGEPGVSELLIPTAASGLAEGPDGALYLAGEGRFLARLDGDEWEVLVPQRDVAPYRDHVVADDGSVYAAFGRWLYEFDGERWVRSEFDDRDKRVTSLERSADGSVWLHLADRLLRRDGRRWVEMQPTGADRAIRVLAIDADPEGRLWAVMDNGVGACAPVTIPIDLLEWAPVADTGIRPRLEGDRRAAPQRPRRCAAGGQLLAGTDGAWMIEERSLRDLTDTTGSLSVGGPRIRLADVDGDGNIWIVAPDRRAMSDLYLIETGLGD